MRSFVTALAACALLLTGCGADAPDSVQKEAPAQAFIDLGLRTDTSKRSVELDEFVGGGPAKDGIPALTNPRFEPLAESTIPNDVRGVLVEIGDDARFYPYSVMVWHEIANDVVGGRPVAVTF